jgi:hypothetical protein
MRACPELSRGDGFAAKAAPTTESNVYVIVWEFIARIFNMFHIRVPSPCEGRRSG